MTHSIKSVAPTFEDARGNEKRSIVTTQHVEKRSIVTTTNTWRKSVQSSPLNTWKSVQSSSLFAAGLASSGHER